MRRAGRDVNLLTAEVVMPVKQIVDEIDSRMKKAVEVLYDELKGVRSGREIGRAHV